MSNWYDSENEELLRSAVAESTSIAGTLRNLGIVAVGGNYKTIKHHITRLDIDTTHQKGGGSVTRKTLKFMAFEATVLGLCQYEVAAILSRKRLPTLTRLSRRHKWLAPVLVGGLTVHLFRQSLIVAEEVLEAVEAALEDSPLEEL